MVETDRQPTPDEKKVVLVKARAREYFLDQIREGSIYDYDNYLQTSRGRERLISFAAEVGGIVIDETLSKENIRKLLEESISTPKQLLEKLKHRFEKISYGIFNGRKLVDQNFGLSYNEHLPLGNFLDEKINPEEYEKYLQEDIYELSVLKKCQLKEPISIQDRADILLGGFIYCITRHWADLGVARALPEIAWTLDQPISVLIEKYKPLITRVRNQARTPKEQLDLDNAMEEQGFLWDAKMDSYINLGLSY